MKIFLGLTGVLLGLIAVGQAVRFFMEIPVQVGAAVLPFWPSAVAALVAAFLSIWAFRLLTD